MLKQDIIYAGRVMRRQPGAALVTILTLAIGIGASTAMFSFVHGVLLRPFPYRDADRLMLVWERNTASGVDRQGVSPPNFVDWRRHQRVFSHIAAASPDSLTLITPAGAVRVPAMSVSGELFETLGVRPAAGRLLTRSDEGAGDPRPIVIAHGFAQAHFGGADAALGRTLTLDNGVFSVAGVLPPEFRHPARADVWMPLAFKPAFLMEKMRGARYLDVFARLRPGTSVAQADQAMRALTGSLARERGTYLDWDTAVVPFHDETIARHRAPLWMLFGAVHVLLLIACANVASLLTARTLARRPELAIRAALGASHLRLVRQLLTESVCLGLIAGVVGTLSAWWLLRPLSRLAPQEMPRLADVRIDWTAMMFAVGVSVLAGVLFGLAPALRSTARRLTPSLHAAGRSTTRRLGPRWLKQPLIALQVALTLILMTGAMLTARTLIARQRVDLGFAPAHVLSGAIALPGTRYASDADRRVFYDQLLARIGGLPGVRSAALATNLPLTGSRMDFAYRIDGRASAEGPAFAQFHSVSAGYFRTLGIPIITGREFSPRDAAEARPVVIINEWLARQYWGNASPLGAHVTVTSQAGPVSREIVGVVPSVRHGGPAHATGPEVYVPYAQDAWSFAYLIVRANGADQEGALPMRVRAELSRLDAGLPIDMVRWMDDLVAAALAPVRFQVVLLGFFALTALALSLIGVYGVLSYAVGLRLRELGIRRALGADDASLRWIVLRDALVPVAVGLAAGALGSFALSRSMRSILFETAPADPLTVTAMALLVLVVCLAAAYGPARRATRADPLTALRMTAS